MKRKRYALIVADVSVYHLPEAPAEVAANAGALLKSENEKWFTVSAVIIWLWVYRFFVNGFFRKLDTGALRNRNKMFKFFFRKAINRRFCFR